MFLKSVKLISNFKNNLHLVKRFLKRVQITALELIGPYLLDHIKDMIDPQIIAFYRDNVLAIVESYSNADLN